MVLLYIGVRSPPWEGASTRAGHVEAERGSPQPPPRRVCGAWRPASWRTRHRRLRVSSERVAQVRGVLAERVVVSTPLDPFLSLRALAGYAGLSVRTLRAYLDLSPDQALPCYRTGGKILVRRSEFDGWMEQYRSRGRPSLVKVMRELGLDTRDVLAAPEVRAPERMLLITLTTQHSINGVRYGPGPVTVREDLAASLRSQEQASQGRG